MHAYNCRPFHWERLDRPANQDLLMERRWDTTRMHPAAAVAFMQQLPDGAVDEEQALVSQSLPGGECVECVWVVVRECGW